jgi:uncharacterized repeat protein (TIGR03803 family)
MKSMPTFRLAASSIGKTSRKRPLALAAGMIMLCLGLASAQPLIVLQNVVSFDGTNDYDPSGTVLQGQDGNFYGTSVDGGPNGLNEGAIYMFTPAGAFTNLVFFNGTNGSNPGSGLIQGSDGNFYGTTLYGGTSFVNPATNGSGTVFKLTTNGVFSDVASFNGANGASPNGLLEVSPGVFYGTANSGGANSNQYGFSSGALFEVKTNGFLTNILSFNDTNGANPSASMLIGRDGNYYGTTTYGGSSEDGTVFELSTNLALTTLFDFTETNGSGPIVLLVGKDGNFYGSTLFGGAYHFGTIFKLTPSNVLTTIATFDSTNGYSPSSLVQATDGNFYGTTSGGGEFNSGTIFEITTNGVVYNLHSFTGGNDGYSGTSLMQASDGSFYGTTSYGGTYGGGNIFRLSIVPVPIIQSAYPSGDGIFTFTWNAVAGQHYRVQYTTDVTLTTDFWHNYENVTATSNIATASDSIGPDEERFYRVIALAPIAPGS